MLRISSEAELALARDELMELWPIGEPAPPRGSVECYRMAIVVTALCSYVIERYPGESPEQLARRLDLGPLR